MIWCCCSRSWSTASSSSSLATFIASWFALSTRFTCTNVNHTAPHHQSEHIVSIQGRYTTPYVPKQANNTIQHHIPHHFTPHVLPYHTPTTPYNTPPHNTCCSYTIPSVSSCQKHPAPPPFWAMHNLITPPRSRFPHTPFPVLPAPSLTRNQNIREK